jgi:protein SCO1/2
MPPVETNRALTEEEIAAQVDSLAADLRHSELAALLREDHPFYEQRSAAAVVRLRGWILLALARAGITDDTLHFVLEELDNGLHPYLVAAAARALRSYPAANSAFAPFVIRALGNIMGHNEPVSFAAYGDYVLVPGTGTSPVGELLETLIWMASAARAVLAEVRALRGPAFPGRLNGRLDTAIQAIAADPPESAPGTQEAACCDLRGMLPWAQHSLHPDQKVIFEDDHGSRLGFEDVFRGHPTIVVFFYTRCDNPLKCTLSISKLGRVQKLLQERGLADRIHTAAITYDPAFDLPARMRSYGERRGLSLDTGNRMLRTVEGTASLRRHFKLGVNFVESVVNRHRIEAYVLDAKGRIAYSFGRLQWEEADVVDRAVTVLDSADARGKSGSASTAFGAMASIGLAVFPKCPVCWAAYLSMLGVAGLQHIPYAPWIEPLLAAGALVNLASVWLRTRTTHRMTGAWMVTAGVALIGLSRFGWVTSGLGVAATLAGSLVSALSTESQP